MKTSIKPILTLFFLIIFFNPELSFSQIVKFAAIGDYGKAGPAELAVSNLVKSWNPDFIITLGDNNYALGEQSTIDSNIGQYYHGFIRPYIGNFEPSDTGLNRFFPSIGNHDWYTGGAPYLAYFTLSGNERYYDFVKGNIHFFVVNSDHTELHGRGRNSIQALWLKDQLSRSSEKWNIIYFHHVPYSSSDVHKSDTALQWPFKSWGASTVLTGHNHHYERLIVDNLTYFVNGLGGYPLIYPFNDTVLAGSQKRYNNTYGAMLITSYNDSLILKFYSLGDTLIDNFKILPAIKLLSLTVNIQGFYNSTTNTLTGDTVIAYLRNYNSPYSIIDSSKSYVDFLGRGNFSFTKAANATKYYLVIKHRNSIETWSDSLKFTANVSNYNFTLSLAQAYGNNMIQIDSTPVRFAIYNGDVNQDGIVDLADLFLIDNDAYNFATGYFPTDLTGDNFVGVDDMAIAENNAYNFVSTVKP
ncbi:MAG: metallophosphoesterase [Bacteroidota bacterium]|nr:metallophosphoesterase [Bacteroidota bacterium]